MKEEEVAMINADNSLYRIYYYYYYHYYYSKKLREIRTGGAHKIKGGDWMMLEMIPKSTGKYREYRREKNNESHVLKWMRERIQ